MAYAVALALSGLTAVAQTRSSAMPDSVLDKRTAEVASTLRCPVCQGESIQDSPADLAQEMRSLVRDMLREGKSPDEVRAYFVGRYGEWILLEPAMTGLNVVLYVFPVVLAIGGCIVIYRLVKKWSAVSQEPSKNPNVHDTEVL